MENSSKFLLFLLVIGRNNESFGPYWGILPILPKINWKNCQKGFAKSAKKYIVDESTDEISNVDSEILKEEAKTWYVNEFKKELDLLKETTDISNNSFTWY